MDADEKISLKASYADIILNISKQAATRIMASERRASRFQHEMKMSKEESLRMLMRMKHIMDSKISEREATSLNQREKIEELEAQLQEAVDIVGDLRGELSRLQEELQGLKNDNFPHENGIPLDTTEYSHHLSLQNRIKLASCPKIPCLDRRRACHECCYIENRDLPSIALRGSKDSSFRRNGRSQRIRACEGNNNLGRETCLSAKTAEAKNRKEDKDMLLPEADLANVRLVSSQSFACKRKRAARKRKPVRALNCYMKTDRESASLVENSSSNGQIENVEDPSEREREIEFTFQRKRKREAPRGPEAADKNPIETVNVEQEENGKKAEEESKRDPSSSRECRRMAQVARQLLSLSERKW